MEYHTYKSMASFCLSHHFQSHVLNRYGSRRQILIKSKLYEKHDFVDILVTPMKVLTVDASLEEGDEGEDQLMVPQNPLEQEVSWFVNKISFFLIILLRSSCLIS